MSNAKTLAGKEYHVESYYFNFTVKKIKGGWRVFNHRNGRSVTIGDDTFEYGCAKTILHYIRGAYMFYNARLKSAAPDIALRCRDELTEVCDALGVVNYSYHSLLHEALADGIIDNLVRREQVAPK